MSARSLRPAPALRASGLALSVRSRRSLCHLCRGLELLCRVPAARHSLCQGPAVSVSGPALLRRSLYRAPALSARSLGALWTGLYSVSGPRRLWVDVCVGPRHSLSRPALCVGRPGALCVGPQQPLCRAPALWCSLCEDPALSARRALSLCRGRALSVSAPTLCVGAGALCVGAGLGRGALFNCCLCRVRQSLSCPALWPILFCRPKAQIPRTPKSHPVTSSDPPHILSTHPTLIPVIRLGCPARIPWDNVVRGP